MAQRRRIEDDEAPAQQTPALHVKYRPTKLADVLGQPAVVKSLEKALEAKARPQTFLFTGPGGTGKTTLARIIAARYGCDAANLIEVDAASNSGVDDVRSLTSGLRYHGFGAAATKAIIIDECHRLSKNAWDALLKTTEEPPPHVVFFFCSTEPDKIPKPMVTRCLTYSLQPVKFSVLLDLLEDVCDREGLKTGDKILQLVADYAEGSPRAALTGLAKVHACDDEEEAQVLLEQAGENAEVIEFCRLLCFQQPSWKDVTKMLAAVGEVPPETIRILITNYVAKILQNPKNQKDVPWFLRILEEFSKPCNPSDKMAPIMIACGRLIVD